MSRREQLCAGLDRVDQVGFVAVERLIKQRHAELPRVLAQLVESFGQIRQAPWPGRRPSPLRPCIEPMMAGAPSGPAKSMIDRMKSAHLCRDRLIGQREVQAMLDPAGAGADGRQAKIVVIEEPAELGRQSASGPGGKSPRRRSPTAWLSGKRPAGRPKRRTGRRVLRAPG